MIRLKTTHSGGNRNVLTERLFRYACFLIFAVTVLWPLPASGYFDGPESVFAFADSLENSGDYYRAITEYRRLAFHWPGHPLATESRFRIGRAYLLGNDPGQASLEFQELLAETLPVNDHLRIRYALAKALFISGKWRLADHQLRHLEQQVRQQIEPPLLYSRLWCYLKPGDIQSALSFWQDVIRDHSGEELPQKQTILQQLQTLSTSPRKNPRLAGFLSAIIPGLGQAYCGRPRNALVSFLVNSLFIGAIAVAIDQDHYETAAVIGFFELGFYSANIYNAINDAHKVNRFEFERNLQHFETCFGPPFNRFDPSFNP
jgi:TM2 domain-containing membrane protein YozV